MKIDINPTNVIENENGEFRSARGPKAVEAFRLRTLIVGVQAEAKGIRMNSRVNCTKVARAETGLKTRDRNKLIEALKKKLDAVLAECVIVTDGE